MTRFAPLVAAFACGIVLAAPPVARAGLLPVQVTVTPEAGDFRWTYAITLPTDAQLQAGNYFTIYDFAGFIPGTGVSPDGWTLATSNVGQTPGLVNLQRPDHRLRVAGAGELLGLVEVRPADRVVLHRPNEPDVRREDRPEHHHDERPRPFGHPERPRTRHTGAGRVGAAGVGAGPARPPGPPANRG
jgi:hypothetical protein